MQDLWKNQLRNLFLWVPFLLAFGAGLYFNLGTEPNLGLCIIGAIMGIIFVILHTPVIVRAISLFLIGFCWAAIFTHFINTPQISHNIHNQEIIGTVTHIDYTYDKTRIYIKTDAAQINAIPDGDAIVRVSAGTNITPPKLGDIIRAKIGLFRPDGADAPESFDYARWMYFNGLTATGYIDEYSVITPSNGGSISDLRDWIHRQTNSFLVDTLVLGYKNAVPKDDAPVWTATGVGHVWSISGFHITLVSAWLFAIFFLIFRAIAPLTRRIPARIPALICAWCGLLFYVILSGTDVATIRAFIMATLVFMAFIVGRHAISVRNVCVAFCIIFIMNPHFVMQAGFQLSFAAIFGLVWLWNDIKPQMPKNKIIKIIYTAILTSGVATLFTAPFVVMHFYELPVYGLIGNLVLLPLFSIAIMPLVCIGVFTSLFGWMWPINFAEQIYDFCLGIGRWITTMPGSTITLSHIPNIAMVFIILGFISIIFIRNIHIKINYIFGGAFLTIGICLAVAQPRPLFYVTNDHELAAFVGNDGKLGFTKSRASNHYFTFNTWRQINGEPAALKNIRRKPENGVWMYETKNFTLAYIQKYVPLQNNIVQMCNNQDIDYIVSYFHIDAPKCNHKILRGGFVIYPNGKIKYVSRTRPWNNPPE